MKNVPGLEEARRNMLILGHRFSGLDESIKQKYVHAASNFSFGWSHGVEKLEGKPDTAKGSFYGNPQYDRPVDDEALIAQYPSFIHPNIWPTEELPELEIAFKTLGCLIVKVGTMIGAQCDKYIKGKCAAYETNRIERVISTSLCCKARLLHYFPMTSEASSETETAVVEDSTNFSSWCGE